MKLDNTQISTYENCNRKEVKQLIFEHGEAPKMLMASAFAMVKYTMLDCMDVVKNLPNYPKYKFMYERAVKAFKDKEASLRLCVGNDLFNVKKLPKHELEHFSEGLTNSQYFAYWQDMGASAYDTYKYRLKMIRNLFKKRLSGRTEYVEEISWLLIMEIAYMEAIRMYQDGVLKAFLKSAYVHTSVTAHVFGAFDLKNCDQAMRKVNRTIFPEINLYVQELCEDKDVQVRVSQLRIAINKNLLSFKSVAQAVKDNDELLDGEEGLKDKLKSNSKLKSVCKRIRENMNK